MDTNSLRKSFLSECVERPWGWYASTFEMDGFKTKVLVVKPRQRLSLQSHEHRKEMWSIVSGEGVCTIDEKVFNVAKDSFVIIHQGAKHRISNTSISDDLVISEVQIGDILSEDDIVRYDDDYGRGE